MRNERSPSRSAFQTISKYRSPPRCETGYFLRLRVRKVNVAARNVSLLTASLTEWRNLNLERKNMNSSPRLFHLLLTVFLSLIATNVHAQAQPAPKEQFEPRVGQEGKDVV